VLFRSGGEIYGTTSTGGRDNAGVVFKIDTSGAETVLYSFTGNADGSNPLAGVILDSEGNLYGTTSAGGSASGSAGYGVVFKVDTSGKETVLHTFTNGADGAFPRADLIADAAGNLYGTTVKGGRGNSHRVDEGTVFKVTPSGQEAVIYNFANTGSAPFGGVVLDSAGNLYGTTDAGGIKGGGIVFKLSAVGEETVLHEFTSAEPNAPSAGVVLDSAGNLYGTTSTGSSPLTEGGGVFVISATGHESVLHVFSDGKGGATPQGGVVADSAGNLYGATSEGGLWGAGAVFKLTPAGRETPLYNFTGGADGAIAGGVVLDSAGNLYGSTFGGGASNLGVVYRLTPGGVETVLHSFTGGSDGMHPSSVILDPQGNVYGSTEGGTIFEIDPAGDETILYTFTDDNESGISGLIRDAAGNLYGTTAGVVDNFNGTVFKLDPLGNLTILHSFTGGADGANPVGGVVEDAQGNYYGTTTYGGALGCGNVFKLDPSGVVTALYDFPSYSSPSGVILDSSGDLFGTIATGGAYRGAVYEVTAGGQEIVLYNFLDGTDGGQPSGPLLLNATGDLYGTGISGGRGGAGVVFEIQP